MKKARFEEASPSFQESGDTAGMYISRNPRFTPGVSERKRETRLSEESNPSLANVRQLLDLAQKINQDENFLQPRQSVIKHPISAYLRYVAETESEVFYWRSNVQFRLVSENGLCVGDSSKLTIVPWESVSRAYVHGDVFGTKVHLLLKQGHSGYLCRSWQPPKSKFQLERKNDIEFSTNYDYLPEAIEWGRGYASNRWKWNVLAPGVSAEKRGKEYLCIAPRFYERFQPITSIPNDVREITQTFLRTSHSFSPKDLNEFNGILKESFKSASLKTLILYYSGHGIASGDELVLAAENSDPQYPFETGVPIYKLVDLTDEYKVINLILILDCCYSGAAGRSLEISFEDIRPTLETLHRSDQVGISIFASSGRDEESLATSEQSVFTGALVEAYRSLFHSYARVTVGDLAARTQERMPENSYQRMRLFMSQQGSEVMLMDQSEQRALAAAQNIKALDDHSKVQREDLEAVDLVLSRSKRSSPSQGKVFRPPEMSRLLKIGRLGRKPVLVLALALIFWIGRLFYVDLFRVASTEWWRAIFYISIAYSIYIIGIVFFCFAYFVLSRYDERDFFYIGRSGFIYRTGDRCLIIPAVSIQSVQAHRYVSRGNVDEYVEVGLTDGETIKLHDCPGLPDTSLAIALGEAYLAGKSIHE